MANFDYFIQGMVDKRTHDSVVTAKYRSRVVVVSCIPGIVVNGTPCPDEWRIVDQGTSFHAPSHTGKGFVQYGVTSNTFTATYCKYVDLNPGESLTLIGDDDNKNFIFTKNLVSSQCTLVNKYWKKSTPFFMLDSSTPNAMQTTTDTTYTFQYYPTEDVIRW